MVRATGTLRRRPAAGASTSSAGAAVEGFLSSVCFAFLSFSLSHSHIFMFLCSAVLILGSAYFLL